MATKKSWAANKYFRFKLKEAKDVAIIDKRAKQGTNENIDRVMANYRVTKDGSRVWSF